MPCDSLIPCEMKLVMMMMMWDILFNNFMNDLTRT